MTILGVIFGTIALAAYPLYIVASFGSLWLLAINAPGIVYLSTEIMFWIMEKVQNRFR